MVSYVDMICLCKFMRNLNDLKNILLLSALYISSTSKPTLFPHLLYISSNYIISVLSELLYGRRGIAPTRNCTHLLKNVLNLFVCIKILLFLKFPFFIWFIHLVGKWMQFRVGAIPSEPYYMSLYKFCTVLCR